MKKVVKIVYEYEDGSKDTIDMPTIPPFKPSEPVFFDNLCPKCDIKLEGVMGYCCPQPKCPTGLGGVWC